jgi:DNA polymerase III epsilon subunit-like protein
MLIIDTECSGLRPDLHSVLSIGALDFRNPDNRFYGECRAFEGAEIMDEALEVNGFTLEQATDPNKQSEAELIQSFLDWSADLPERTLTGQNVPFDYNMLEAAARRGRLNWNLAHRTIDIHTLCWMHVIKSGGQPPVDEKHRRTALNSHAVQKYCGVPNEVDPHNALTGALWHAEVTSRLLYDKKLLPEFEAFEIPWIDS